MTVINISHVLAMGLQVIKFKTLQPHSQFWSVLVHLLHCSYVMKRKPRPHDGIATMDLDKNRLVEFPLSGSEPPDDRTRIQ